MTGEFQHCIDNKGRVFIPAKLRDELGDVFFLTVSSEKCLCCYSNDAWDSFSKRVNELSYLRQRKMRPLFANACRCELDSQGRILIPSRLRSYAGLDKGVTVVGSNTHAEIWDTDRWNAISYLETSPENLQAVMEELEF